MRPPAVSQFLLPLLALSFAFTACTDSTKTSGTTGANGVIPENLIDTAAQSLGAPTEQVEVDEPIELAPSSCVIYSVWDNGTMDAQGLRFAALADGTLVEGATEGAASTVLESCFFDADQTPTAQAMARVVVELDMTPGPLRILPATNTTMLEGTGVTYAEPVLTDNDGVATVRFLAENVELHTALSVEAVRSNDGQLTVTYTDLGS